MIMVNLLSKKSRAEQIFQRPARYKSLLEEEYAELTTFLPHRENITVARMPDAVDEAVLAAEREIEIRTLDDGLTLLRKVSAALRRIESNHSGTCTGCGERISPKLLDALPWTPLCIVSIAAGPGSPRAC